jgi:hypothetical protein
MDLSDVIHLTLFPACPTLLVTFLHAQGLWTSKNSVAAILKMDNEIVDTGFVAIEYQATFGPKSCKDNR